MQPLFIQAQTEGPGWAQKGRGPGGCGSIPGLSAALPHPGSFYNTGLLRN